MQGKGYHQGTNKYQVTYAMQNIKFLLCVFGNYGKKLAMILP